MKIAILLGLLAVVAAYDDISDNYRPEDVVKNITLLKNHIDCYIDKIPCEGPPATYKKYVLQILNDGCQECNERQKHQFKLEFKAMAELLPAEFEEMKKKYDPTGEHFSKDMELIKTYAK